MPDYEFIDAQPVMEFSDDVAFLHIDAHDFAMRPNMALRFIEASFRTIADWLAGKAEE